MTYGDDQRLELLERAVHDIAGIVGEIAKDRGMVATLTDIRVRFAPPETRREAVDWSHDEPGPM